MIQINLSEKELAYLNEVSGRKDTSKNAIMRSALRLYQLWDAGRVEFKNEDGLTLMLVE